MPAFFCCLDMGCIEDHFVCSVLVILGGHCLHCVFLALCLAHTSSFLHGAEGHFYVVEGLGLWASAPSLITKNRRLCWLWTSLRVVFSALRCLGGESVVFQEGVFRMQFH